MRKKPTLHRNCAECGARLSLVFQAAVLIALTAHFNFTESAAAPALTGPVAHWTRRCITRRVDVIHYPSSTVASGTKSVARGVTIVARVSGHSVSLYFRHSDPVRH